MEAVPRPRGARRSTRVRVEIPITVTSLDRIHHFQETCIALIVSPQGCGFRSSRALDIGTPVLLSELPVGATVTARVATCLPLGDEGKYFLVGVSLYTHGNVWGIADPPEDWNTTESVAPAAAAAAGGNGMPASGKSWPYNMFSNKGEAHPGRK